MDGKRAAINVLLGVAVGLSVPIVVAALLGQLHHEFKWWPDHIFIVAFLSLLGGGIGLLVNLPWEQTPPPPRTPEESERDARRFYFDDGLDDIASASAAGPAPDAPTPAPLPSRRRALRVLHLQADADDDAVRQAFRRLAKEHHPDQFNAQGAEAVAAATQRFKAIREAYETLTETAPA